MRRIWYRAPRRRTQRRLTWERYARLLERFAPPTPHITQARTVVAYWLDKPCEEPSARKTHARIRERKSQMAGERRGKTTSLGRSKSTSVRHPTESGGTVGPGKALPTHHQKQLGVWDPGAFPVPQKLNFHMLSELVDRSRRSPRSHTPELIRTAASRPDDVLRLRTGGLGFDKRQASRSPLPPSNRRTASRAR